MTISEARALALNPQAFHHADKFVVLDAAGRPTESQPTEGRARRAVDNLNDHETRNGRPALYTFRSVAA